MDFSAFHFVCHHDRYRCSRLALRMDGVAFRFSVVSSLAGAAGKGTVPLLAAGRSCFSRASRSASLSSLSSASSLGTSAIRDISALYSYRRNKTSADLASPHSTYPCASRSASVLARAKRCRRAGSRTASSSLGSANHHRVLDVWRNLAVRGPMCRGC